MTDDDVCFESIRILKDLPPSDTIKHQPRNSDTGECFKHPWVPGDEYFESRRIETRTNEITTTMQSQQVINKLVMDPAECALHIADQNMILGSTVRDGVDHILNQNSTNTMGLTNKISDSAATIISNANNNTDTLLNNANENSNFISGQQQGLSNRVSDIGEKNLLATGASSLCTQKEISDLQWRLMESHGRRFDHMHDHHDRHQHETRREHSENLIQLKDVQTEILRARGEIEKDVALSKASLEKEVALSKGHIELQMLKTKCDIERQASDNKSSLEKDILISKFELSKQASDNAARQELQACANKDFLSRQMLEGFCSVKDKIESKSCETIEMLKTLENHRIKVRLHDFLNHNLP
jgi:hypothetical protein